jgi:hypothetical protein
MLVKLMDNPAEDVVHGFGMEEVCVPSNTLMDAYFAGPAMVDLMRGTTVLLDEV